MDRLEEILEERNKEYGNASVIGSKLLNLLPVLGSEHSHNFCLLVSKLARLSYNPIHHDSWLDIMGYAKLTRLGMVDNRTIYALPMYTKVTCDAMVSKVEEIIKGSNIDKHALRVLYVSIVSKLVTSLYIPSNCKGHLLAIEQYASDALHWIDCL